MENIEEILLDIELRMEKAVEALDREFSTVRTGRATPGLIENLVVDYHGTNMPLNQLATISAPEARLLVVQPWDRNAIEFIEKAISNSDLGLVPGNDGILVRLAIPQLTEERRKEMAKVVRKKTEEGKIAIRNLRRDAQEKLRSLEKNKEASQDEVKRAMDQLQRQTDTHTSEMGGRADKKEADLMEV
jgi:ribosome recycling factor